MTDQNNRDAKPRGHVRQRSSNQASSDSTASRNRSRQQPSQKAMLSRALQRANQAVQLDNQQNFESARQSYSEACGLLQQVLERTYGEEDKKKLEAIVSLSPGVNLRYMCPPSNIDDEHSARHTPAVSSSWTRCCQPMTRLYPQDREATPRRRSPRGPHRPRLKIARRSPSSRRQRLQE